MKTTGRRSQYSPVRQMTRTSTPIEANLDAQQTYAKQHGQGSLHSFDQNHPDHPEEVYICNCCGLTKQVGPSIQFMTTFKALFFLFNFLVFVFGFLNLGVGLWFRIDPKVYEIHKYIETQNFTNAGWIILLAGFIAILMSLSGFAAANRQSAANLVLYFIIMIVLTLSFVGALVLLTVYGLGSSLQKFLEKEINEQIRRRTMNTELDLFISSDAAQFLDFIQVKMRCCGATGFTDYGKFGMAVPITCHTIDKNFISAPGCGFAIRRLFDIRAGLAIGFSSASILVQMITTTLAALMFCSIYNWRRINSAKAEISSLPVGVRRDSPYQMETNLQHQRPRSRTPIVM